jgi:arabinofuranosyltransferase
MNRTVTSGLGERFEEPGCTARYEEAGSLVSLANQGESVPSSWLSPTHALILSVGLARLALGLWLGFRPFDDTYITFRYALNLASGFGFVYNSGEHVLGTTSPLWAMALALGRLAHVPIEPGSLALSLTLDVATAVLMFRLLASLRYGVTISLGAAVLFLCWFDYFSLARSGMETSCFVFLVTAALGSIVSSRFARAAVSCALACLTRPEGAVLVVLLMIALWRVRSRVAKREVALCLAVLLTIAGGWAIYALETFGSVVSQSVWFAQRYELVVSRHDPYADREYRTYRIRR